MSRHVGDSAILAGVRACGGGGPEPEEASYGDVPACVFRRQLIHFTEPSLRKLNDFLGVFTGCERLPSTLHNMGLMKLRRPFRQ